MTSNNSHISFEYMYQKYKNTVYLMIGKVINDTDLKNDCMQEIFMKYFKSMDKVIGEEDSRRWLMAIAHNTIIDMSKKDSMYKNRVKLTPDENEVLHFCDLSENLPLDNILKNELVEKVAEAISCMKPIHKEVIRLKYYLDFTPKEIAAFCETPIDTVYSRLRRAEEIIQKEIERYMRDKGI